MAILSQRRAQCRARQHAEKLGDRAKETKRKAKKSIGIARTAIRRIIAIESSAQIAANSEKWKALR